MDDLPAIPSQMFIVGIQLLYLNRAARNASRGTMIAKNESVVLSTLIEQKLLYLDADQRYAITPRGAAYREMLQVQRALLKQTV